MSSSEMFDSQIGPTQEYESESQHHDSPDGDHLGDWGRLVPLVPDCAEVVLTNDKSEVRVVVRSVAFMLVLMLTAGAFPGISTPLVAAGTAT